MKIKSDKKPFVELVGFVKSIYGESFVPLHRPVFEGNEKKYLLECIDSNFVSSVGSLVTKFENSMAIFTGSTFGIATVNGTSALHTALMAVGVQPGDEVITQALTFVATPNAISYCRAEPVFVDVDSDTLGLSPYALRAWLEKNTKQVHGQSFNKKTNSRVVACVPMHTFGIPARILEIKSICDEFNLQLIEDAAESLGSYVGNTHTGKFGAAAAFSFNGNKILTTGGGGMITTSDKKISERCKHLTTTAKKPHHYEYVHDEVGYNYRMPNLNAALGVAQLEKLNHMLKIKADIAEKYRRFCDYIDIHFVEALEGTTSNNWLNAIVFKNRLERDEFLNYSNENDVMTRPIWRTMVELEMYSSCQHDDLKNTYWLADRLVNLPSSVP